MLSYKVEVRSSTVKRISRCGPSLEREYRRNGSRRRGRGVLGCGRKFRTLSQDLCGALSDLYEFHT